jgi:hypothetical protein
MLTGCRTPLYVVSVEESSALGVSPSDNAAAGLVARLQEDESLARLQSGPTQKVLGGERRVSTPILPNATKL